MGKPSNDFKSPPGQITAKNVTLKVKDIGKYGYKSPGKVDQSVGIEQNKQYFIPSFGVLTDLFNSHLETLQNLKLKIERLRQASAAQYDSEKTWQSVDSILSVLDAACIFLSVD
jgi:hypothetical protein